MFTIHIYCGCWIEITIHFCLTWLLKKSFCLLFDNNSAFFHSTDCPWALKSTVSSGERSSSPWIKMWSEQTGATSSLEERITRMWRSWGLTRSFFLLCLIQSLSLPASLRPSLSLSLLSWMYARTYGIHFIFWTLGELQMSFMLYWLWLSRLSTFWRILGANGFLNEVQEDLNSILV